MTIEINNKIEQIKQSTPSILIDFKKSFINVKKYPEQEDYQKQLLQIKNIMKTNILTLFDLKNQINKQQDNLNKNFKSSHNLIHLEEIKKKKLEENTLNNNIYGIINSNNKRVYDYQTLYRNQYVKNNILLIGIIELIFSIRNLYLIKV